MPGAGQPPTRAASGDRLTVVAWRDPTLDARGHRPGSPYVEAVWLSVLGPSTTWAWQRLSRIAAGSPGAVIDLADLAGSLGLSKRVGRNSPMRHALDRMVAFHAAARTGDSLAARLALPDVSRRQLTRLPRSAQLAHHRWAAASAPAAPPERHVTIGVGP